MSFLEEKFETAIVVLSVALFGGIFYLAKGPIQAHIAAADVSYEMPRPKSFWADLFGLGLSDREIDRKYVNPFDKKKAEDKKIAQEKAPVKAAPVLAQTKVEAKKAQDDATKKSKVDVNIVGDDRTAMSAEDIKFSSHGRSVAKSYGVNTATSSTSSEDNTKDKKGGLNLEQWRSLLLGQPTKENVAKLMSAYIAQDVDDATYYAIVGDLLHENKPEVQDLGLYAAGSFFSASSFSAVAKAFDQMNPEGQAKAQKYLMSYSVGRRSNLLLVVLNDNNAVVIDLATQVILKAFDQSKGSTTVEIDPRKLRGDGNSSFATTADFQKFVPIYQKLARSSDSAIANIANSALQQMQFNIAAN
jgi:hypothetical protein